MNVSISFKLPEGFPKPEITIDGEAPAANGCAQARFVPTPSKAETVIDNNTGLMWDAVGSDKKMTHKEAEAYVKTLKLGGFTDWRLPTIHELLTLVDYSRTAPAIDTSVFTCKSDWYWTSTPCAGGSDHAWVVGFNGGSSYWGYRSLDAFVRAVRPSQS